MYARTLVHLLVAAAAAISLLALPSAGLARESARVLYVPPGDNPTKAAGSVQGKNDALYRISAKAGQQLSVTLWSERPTTYFNIEREGAGEPLFVGQNAPNQAFDASVPAAGSYLIRIYQMGAAASENKRTKYQLVVRLTRSSGVAGKPGSGTPGAATAGAPMEYDINRLSDGSFEVVWPQRGCIATANPAGEILRFNERCTDDLTGKSRDIARREARSAPRTEYSINRLANGNFEIVWPDRGCTATANRSGEILGFSDRCTDDLTVRARDIARREK